MLRDAVERLLRARDLYVRLRARRAALRRSEVLVVVVFEHNDNDVLEV